MKINIHVLEDEDISKLERLGKVLRLFYKKPKRDKHGRFVKELEEGK